jgi:hypothetical protein
MTVTLSLPISCAVAIQRYRLFDVDALINRTLVYSALTAVLAGIYIVGVVGAQAIVRGLGGPASRDSPPAVVVITLLIAALFRPLRRRIQVTIDRRFYRRKYDAARTLAAFGATLRDALELNELSERLVAVVEETMQPAHVSLWLRPPPTDEAARSVSRRT